MRRILLISLLLFPCAALAAPQHGSALYFAANRNWTDARQQAKNAGDSALQTLVDWQYMLDADSGAGFDEISRFMREHSEWPLQNKLQVRAELALQTMQPPDDEMIAFFERNAPISGAGKIAYADALSRSGGDSAKISALIREGWIGGDFDDVTEHFLRDRYSNTLTGEDHIKRTDRLLWEEKAGAAKRMLALLPDGQQKLSEARIALIENKKAAPMMVGQVPSSLKNDPGLIYERMRYRAKHDDNEGVREMLLAAPAEPPYPEKWWKQRELQIREAIDENNISLAKKLLANHGQTEGAQLADAKWLLGWVLLEFSNHPKEAFEQFFAMYNNVRFPVSKARAAFWAGRASEKSGDSDAARSWYDTAASYPTTFYGQLAALKLNAGAPLNIPSPPAIGDEQRSAFNNSEMVRAIRLAIKMGATDLASKLININIDTTKDADSAVLFSEIGMSTSQPYLSVRGAKKALQQHNAVLIKEGYPRPKTPGDLAVPRELALAISRQESEFDPEARSPAGALGMMQLMPRTARETARKNDMRFDAGRLSEPDYNMRLGSHYLGRLIDAYDGSYVMAIAAYNAGPGNVRNWMSQFGTPGSDIDSALAWIEKIPFSETRNYVQRVLENIQVYRHIEAGNDAPKLMLGEDLVR